MDKILGVDLDEVLSDTINEILKFHDYKIKGMSLQKYQITDYHIPNLPEYNISLDDAMNFFESFWESEAKENILPVVGAQAKLQELKNQGWKMFAVTARNENIRGYTLKRLEKYYPGCIDNILFANHFTEREVSKSELCKQNNIKIMVEDNLEYSIDLANNGIKVFLLDRPWNQKYDSKIHKNITKVSSWNEINPLSLT